MYPRGNTSVLEVSMEDDQSHSLAEEIVDTVREPILVLGEDLTVRRANTSFYRQFKVGPEETVGLLIYELGNGQWDIPELRELLENVLPENSIFNDFEVQHTFENIGRRTMLLNARRIDKLQLILLALEDITDRKTTQDELREKEERFRMLVEASSQAVWEADPRGMAIGASPSWQAYTGQRPEEILGTGWLNAVHPEDRPYAGRKWREAVQEGHPFEAEFRLRSAEGGWRWTRVDAAPIRDAKGNILKWVGKNLDITDRKQSEADLRESQERFRKIFRLSPNMTVISTVQEGRIIDVNRAFEVITGFSRRESVGKTSLELNLWKRKEDRFRLSALLSDQKPIREEEIEVVTKSGALKTLLLSAELIEIGGERCVISSASDITELKKAQQNYLASERNFREAFAHAPIGMVITDLKGNFLHVNEAYCQITGYSEEELLQPEHGFQKFTHPEDLGLNLEEFNKVLRGEIPAFFVEKRYIQKSGKTIWVRASATARRDANGHPFQIVGLVENITTKKLAQTALEQSRDELKRAKEAAEEASHSKSEFLARMSHEIRTPMTAFMAAIEHLKNIDTDPERCRVLDVADRSAKRLRNLINEILDFSQIEARRVSFREEPFELRSCVTDIVEMFSLPAREKNLELVTSVSPNIPSLVIGDPDRVGQILINLIGNAIKFTHEGEIRISCLQRNGMLEFSVSDTGIGIPETKFDLIFQSFTQANGTFSRKYGGSGLGLAISKGLVELMNGEITVQSQEGRGSIFTFSLPLRTVEPSGSVPTEDSKGLQEYPLATRILLAEDEPMIQEMIKLMLSQKGWEVDVAATGKEAWEKWKDGKYSLILMDLQMPEMGGLEVSQMIRKMEDEDKDRTCIIALTAHVGPDVTNMCLRSGMDYVINKPVQMNSLLEVIANCLKRP